MKVAKQQSHSQRRRYCRKPDCSGHQIAYYLDRDNKWGHIREVLIVGVPQSALAKAVLCDEEIPIYIHW